MRKLFYLLIVFAAISCGQKANTETKVASIATPKNKWQTYVDSCIPLQNSDLFDNVDFRHHFDTAGIGESPVKFIKSEIGIEKDWVGNTKSNIKFEFANVSKRPISAVKFRWYCEDAFGDPELLFDDHLRMSIGQGRSDKSILPGAICSYAWVGSHSESLKKVVKTWAYEVAFEDGTIWKAGK